MGKTARSSTGPLGARKHPHGRGEDRLWEQAGAVRRETPPRAWGRQSRIIPGYIRLRNTPTGVGKTSPGVHVSISTGKHPHGRGEDACQAAGEFEVEETPPRAWGRLSTRSLGIDFLRNTPTGVGKTFLLSKSLIANEKHPHGRGEDNTFFRRYPVQIETPPRAWGRHQSNRAAGGRRRNTPTGVGKTITKSIRKSCLQKHPHGRGEDAVPAASSATVWETPPRAWGRLLGYGVRFRSDGNTPTGVGKTNAVALVSFIPRKHPHGRGEDSRLKIALFRA